MSSPENEQTITPPQLIFNERLDVLCCSGTLVDIRPSATPERYRLVECAPLVAKQADLRVWEFTDFPSFPYCTISYVWRGNKIPEDYNPGSLDVPAFDDDRTIAVRGAEDGDPIGIEVLQQACLAAMKNDAAWIWLDRLCILQTNTQDKTWQITNMYKIYDSCSLCIVAPGGLRRLVTLREETGWIHRGWTLQEALAPSVVKVLFAWTRPGYDAHAGAGSAGLDISGFTGEIEQVVQRKSAVAPLWLILDACLSGQLKLYEPDDTGAGSKDTFDRVSIFGARPTQAGNGTSNHDTRFALPNVAALALALSRSMRGEYDRKCYAIWKCALMRTSSRPVDMIFSIMGLFGVVLDVAKFNKNDRIGATVELTREILRREGGRANWLGLCFYAPPCPQLSIFPTFPRTAVAGKAMIHAQASGGYVEMVKLMDNEYPNAEVLGPMPQGYVDADGYFTFRAKSIQIIKHRDAAVWDDQPSARSAQSGPQWKAAVLKASNGEMWKYHEESPDVGNSELHETLPQKKTFAILIGCFFGYTPTQTLAYDCNNVRAMIASEHAHGKLNIVSYLMISISAIDWAYSWSEREFCVGGPEPNLKQSQDDGLQGGIDGREMPMDAYHYIPSPDRTSTFGSIRSSRILELAAKARQSIA